MIVFDASTIVGVALKIDSTPERALLFALEGDVIALSPEVDAEIADVLSRSKFVRLISNFRRKATLALLREQAAWFRPSVAVNDCRDYKDNKYLELALAAEAAIIVSSDRDLLVLDPWRGIRILSPADYLGAGPGTRGDPDFGS